MRITHAALAAGLAVLLLSATRTSQAVSPPAANNLHLASVHTVLVDASNGSTLFAKRADVPVPIASITKLMTALVVLDSGAPMDEWLEILDWDPAPANNAFSRVRVGSQATRGDLLRISLMSSENRAAHQLARYHPGGFAAFVAAMNAKAAALGMHHSTFEDPTGLAPGNVSTASDLARMLLAADAYPLIRKYSSTPQHDVRFRNPRYVLAYGNTNPLTRRAGWQVEVTKTGYLTEAGRCLAMVAEVDGRRVAMVFLNSLGRRSPLGDAGRVRRWLTTGVSGEVNPEAREYERRIGSTLGQVAGGG